MTLLRLYLSDARMKLGYSQYMVAKLTHMPHQNYCRIENGVIGKDIAFRTLVNIARVLKIPYQDLVNYELEYQGKLQNHK